MSTPHFREDLPVAKGKYPGLNPRREVAGGMQREFDVPVAMRDGVRIYVNVFRPEREGQLRGVGRLRVCASQGGRSWPRAAAGLVYRGDQKLAAARGGC